MSFGEEIRKAVDKKYKPGYGQVVRASLIAVSSSIIKMTPVDTGRARANWLPSIDTPKNGTTQSETVNFAAVTSTISDSVGSVFYLTNNLRYIGDLEFGRFFGPTAKVTGDGFSKQAPAGMVRVSIANFEKNIQKAITQLPK